MESSTHDSGRTAPPTRSRIYNAIDHHHRAVQRQMFCNKVVPKSFGSERLKKTPILREKLMISQKVLQAFYYYLTEVWTKVVLNRERLHALLSAESRAPSSTTSYLLPPIKVIET